MRRTIVMLAVAWYLILRTATTGITIGPFDSESECQENAKVLIQLLQHFEVELIVGRCMERQEA